jgi:hypothetical protein
MSKKLAIGLVALAAVAASAVPAAAGGKHRPHHPHHKAWFHFHWPVHAYQYGYDHAGPRCGVFYRNWKYTGKRYWRSKYGACRNRW